MAHTFANADLSGAVFREVDLTGARMLGVLLRGVDIDGDITGLRVNGVEVAPLIGAETLSDADRHRSVNGEWSLAQTLRHLVFVTDSWFGHAVLGEPDPFHPIALPAGFITDGASYGIDEHAAPAFDEIVTVRNGRIERLRAFLHTATPADLDRVREPNPRPGWPPPAPRTALECLQVIFNEEWAHHQFAVRDLAIIEAGAA
jgi:hypothetical protein